MTTKDEIVKITVYGETLRATVQGLLCMAHELEELDMEKVRELGRPNINMIVTALFVLIKKIGGAYGTDTDLFCKIVGESLVNSSHIADVPYDEEVKL